MRQSLIIAVLSVVSLSLAGSGCKGSNDGDGGGGPARAVAAAAQKPMTYPLKLQRDTVGRKLRIRFQATYAQHERAYDGEKAGGRSEDVVEVRGALIHQTTAVLDGRAVWTRARIRFEDVEARDKPGTGAYRTLMVRNAAFLLKRGRELTVAREDGSPVSRRMKNIFHALYEPQADQLQPTLDTLFGKPEVKPGQRWTPDSLHLVRATKAHALMRALEFGPKLTGKLEVSLEDAKGGQNLRIAGALKIPVIGASAIPHYTGEVTLVFSAEAPLDPEQPLRGLTVKYLIAGRGKLPSGQQFSESAEISRRFTEMELIE
jgi:hypothetical protein